MNGISSTYLSSQAHRHVQHGPVWIPLLIQLDKPLSPTPIPIPIPILIPILIPISFEITGLMLNGKSEIDVEELRPYVIFQVQKPFYLSQFPNKFSTYLESSLLRITPWKYELYEFLSEMAYSHFFTV